ncbi:MAG: ABC transporter substrate-binding protein [Actinobacteria bacterium]|nr:ABC transporter substrate-binding protein [Actinomycetota bacterium]MDA2961190.1 ABC transporter substrate-binding protein [Actinomycetota bacterium]MDA2994116.1 ABC transporter substrate-binding protein [Actinomycetota bacterium]
MRRKSLYRAVALLAAAGLIAGACGGSDDSAPADTSEETSEEAAAEEPAVEAGDEAEGDVDTAIEEEESAVNYGGSISVGVEAEATGLRPWEDTCSSPCYNMMIAVYDKLMEQDVNGAYTPYLAESITPNEDFTVWTMTLRSGVTFHNGVELTAQTIADMFLIQQAGAAGSSTVSAANLVSVEATGDLEVTYTLSQGGSAFPASLSRAALGMVFEPAAAAADSEGYSMAPIGTGPFVIDSRDLDNETTFVRNDSYWATDPDGNALPYLDSISFRPIPDEGTRLDALLSGTVNAMQTLRQGTIRDARAARDDDGAAITLYEFQGNNVGGGMFNTAVPPFDDVRVRRALVLMNSQEQVIEALGGTGISLPGTQWFSPDSVWWSEKVAEAWPQFDFEAGVETLTEYVNDPERSDGKAVGEPIDAELSCPPDPTLIASMQVLEQAYTASGLVNVTMTNYDQQTHINNALGMDNGFIGSHQVHCWRWGDDADPSVPLNPALAPPTAEVAEAIGLPGVVSPLNFPNWFSPTAFQAAVAATKTDDFATRYGLYEAIMLEIADQVPVYYSGHTATAIATESNIFGLNSWHVPSGELGIGFPNAEGRWSEVFIAS